MAMRGVLVWLIASALTAMALVQKPATSQSANPAPMPPGHAAGGVIVAELSKSIDARKARAGDKIEARVTMDVLAHGEIVIPRGTKIVGHVSDAKARTKQAPGSMVEIAFDRLLLKRGREVLLQATIQAIGVRTQTSAEGNEAVGDTAGPETVGPQSAPGRNEQRRILGSAFPGSLTPANAGAVTDKSANSGGSSRDSARSLEPSRQGVIGMKGIALSQTAQGSAISSTRENVHLSSGTQLVLRVTEPQVLVDSLRRAKN
jgi:hypothetical protein